MEVSFLGYLGKYFVFLTLMVGLLIIMGVESFKKKKTESGIAMIHLLIGLFVITIVDYFELSLHEGEVFNVWRQVLSMVSYIIRPALVVFCVPLLNANIGKKERVLIWIPSIINTLLYLSCWFNHWTFWFTEDNSFHRGPLGYSFIIVAAINLAVVLAETIRRRNQYTVHELTVIGFCAVAILVSAVLEIKNIILDICYPVIMGSCIIYYLYLSIQNQRVENLRVQLDTAEKANRAKTVFLNNISHDIRTPMNAIVGFTNLSKKHIDDKELLTGYLDKISISSEHLLKLINEVLEMSRIESGNIILEKDNVSLSDLFENIKVINSSDYAKKNLSFSLRFINLNDDMVFCDKLRLTQVVMNLVSNAIKYTPAGGKVWISLEETSCSDHSASYEITVRDNGIGISEEFLDKIYKPFERESSSTVSGIQGTGLGLSITKSFIDLMHGKISVVSKKNEGSTFKVNLTFDLVGEAAHKHEETPKSIEELKAAFAGRHVLLVEDNILNQEIASEMLKEVGFSVEVASNGKESVDMVKENNAYDFILMDIQMPVMDGYEATKEIRNLEDATKSKTPIIATTANAFLEDKLEAYKQGMDGYIPKPIDVRQLYGVLSDYLDEKKN